MNKIYQQRIDQLQRRLKKSELDSILVTDVSNVTYLTGFTGDSSYLLVNKKNCILISDTRFETQIAEECPGLAAEIRDSRMTTVQAAVNVVTAVKVATLGVEGDSLTKSAFDDLSEKLDGQCSLVPTSGWVEQMRMIKSPVEIEAICRSIAINERAFEIIRSRIQPDQTERQIGFDLEYEMRRLGADGCAFSPIVGVGERSALPHAVLSNKRIAESPFLLVDWGARVDGYCSDLTRMIFVGKPPTKMVKIFEVVHRAQQAAIDKIRPGVEFREVDQAARSVIEKAGFGKYFGHGLGHGFGMKVHEVPLMNPIREGKLEPNMTVTVEPGIYLPGFGGVRIEDDCLVTQDGVEVLSSLPKDFESSQFQIL